MKFKILDLKQAGKNFDVYIEYEKETHNFIFAIQELENTTRWLTMIRHTIQRWNREKMDYTKQINEKRKLLKNTEHEV